VSWCLCGCVRSGFLTLRWFDFASDTDTSQAQAQAGSRAGGREPEVSNSGDRGSRIAG